MVEEWEVERRAEPSFVAGERETIEGWLEFHRLTLELKCEGLTDAQRKARPVATSAISLHGLVRHMAEVERLWFPTVLGGDRSRARVYEGTDAVEDGERAPLDDADFEADLAAFRAECASSRAIAARRAIPPDSWCG